MPITQTGQGYGLSSALKREHFRKFLSVHTKICQSIIKRKHWAYQKYVYVDLNAGTGYYEEDEGSPVSFLKAVGIEHKAYFVEIDEQAAHLLQANTQTLGRGGSNVICGDNKIMLPHITKDLQRLTSGNSGKNKLAFGLIYSDENGTDIPFNEMSQALSQPHMEKIDVLIYVSCTALKRVMKALPAKGCRRISEYISLMPKQHWQVRQPVGAHQWCFLFGTNWPEYPQLTKQGFYKIDSVEGQAILDRVSNTVEEIKELNLKKSGFIQQSLFDLSAY